MFLLTENGTKVFINVFKTMQNIINNVYLQISIEGICIQSMNANKTTFLDLLISKEQFDEFECDEETDATIAINVSSLMKILNFYEMNDKLKFDFGNNETDLLHLIFQNNSMLSNQILNMFLNDTFFSNKD